MKKVIALIAFLAASGPAFAQDQATQKATSEAFPAGTFYMEFHKRLAANPFYSWQGTIGGNFIGFRRGALSIRGEIDFQAAGAQAHQKQISIAGTAYIIKGCVQYDIKPEQTSVAVCDNHLSSHIADLPKLLREARLKDTEVPAISEKDMNILTLGLSHAFRGIALKPEIAVRFQPLSFRYRGGAKFYEQPVFISTRSTLWQRGQTRIFFFTKHEIGKSSFSDGQLALDLFPHGQAEGRARIFAGFSPNRQIQANIEDGWRGGRWTLGVRLIWDAK